MRCLWGATTNIPETYDTGGNHVHPLRKNRDVSVSCGHTPIKMTNKYGGRQQYTAVNTVPINTRYVPSTAVDMDIKIYILRIVLLLYSNDG